MSNQQSSFTSSSFSYSSSSSSNNDGTVTGQHSSHQSYTDPSGHTTVRSSNQKLGEPAFHETRQFDSAGRELIGNGDSAAGGQLRIEEVSDEEQARRDALYEERMEDEYAKREGGA